MLKKKLNLNNRLMNLRKMKMKISKKIKSKMRNTSKK